MDPHQFDTFSDEELRLIAALTAGALNNALLIERLENKNMLFAPTVAFKPTVKTEIIGLSPLMRQQHENSQLIPLTYVV